MGWSAGLAPERAREDTCSVVAEAAGEEDAWGTEGEEDGEGGARKWLVVVSGLSPADLEGGGKVEEKESGGA